MSKKIAIFGAASHIAKGLIYNFIRENECRLFLFARFPEKVKEFLKLNSLKGKIDLVSFNDFAHKEYDFIINCVGVGTPNKVRDNPSLIFSITEKYDNMILNYLSKFIKTGYINFSSGAVYGGSFKEAVGEFSGHNISLNNFDWQDYYGIAKINSEAKHRAEKGSNIVDIRVFAYFSRFVDLKAGYFLTDLIESIRQGNQFITSSCDFVRDYLHHSDLFALIKLIMARRPFNTALDAYSKKPISKFELLDYFSKNYGLKYRVDKNLNFSCPTGEKNFYYSNSRKAADLGYKPNYSSIDTVMKEASFILGKSNE